MTPATRDIAIRIFLEKARQSDEAADAAFDLGWKDTHAAHCIVANECRIAAARLRVADEAEEQAEKIAAAVAIPSADRAKLAREIAIALRRARE